MDLGEYRLLTQLGAGRDGVAYRAQLPGSPGLVEVRILAGARADTARWPAVKRRLRLAALLDHPVAMRLLAAELEHDPPYTVLEWVGEQTLAGELHLRPPLSVEQIAVLGRDLASVLAAAHRLGLVHGRLSPGQIFWDSRRLKLDFTGLDVGPSHITVPTAACRPPGGEAVLGSAGDVYSLGALLAWALADRTRMPDQAAAPANTASPLTELLREMLAPEPEDRPTARQVAERLAVIFEPDSLGAISVQQTVAAPPVVGGDPPAVRLGRARLLQELGEEKPAEVSWAPDERLGRFRLLEKLGQGGMGVVYRAEDVTDGSVVAIKVLQGAQGARAEARRRFFKEARLLAEANNPHVTNLLEVNEDEGRVYLVLEFVAGRDLGRVLEERGRLEEPVALAMMADVARALVTAHERGLVHRDIKPDNILLQEGGADGQPFRVKLSDFGLARHVDQSKSLQVTRTGAILGTPLYMAPEQCEGGAVDQRTDVYAMGATLFHLLAGRPPFVADTPLALATMHRQESPPLLHQVNPSVSEATARVVERCLAKSPDARYPDAQALLDELTRLLRGEPAHVAVHPRLPACDPRSVVSYDWTWELEASRGVVAVRVEHGAAQPRRRTAGR